MSGQKVDIHVCTRGKRCCKKGSGENLAALKRSVRELGVKDLVVIHQEDCMSLCSRGPNMLVKPDFVRYEHVSPDDCRKIIEKHVLGKNIELPNAKESKQKK